MVRGPPGFVNSREHFLSKAALTFFSLEDKLSGGLPDFDKSILGRMRRDGYTLLTVGSWLFIIFGSKALEQDLRFTICDLESGNGNRKSTIENQGVVV
jgi:hypothetical protein